MALRGVVVEAAFHLDSLRERADQLTQRPPSLGVVKREDDEARGFGNDVLHVHHHTEKRRTEWRTDI